jgi:vacuolar-type H+-ATPase subunit E/Vma4
MTAAAQVAALAPVRAHLLCQAQAEADRITEEARSTATAILRQARSAADEAVAVAPAQGRADAALAAAVEQAQGRKQARSIVLGAQREAYEEFCAQVLAAADGMRDEPGYWRLLSRLITMATQAAGPGAATAVQPEGGVVARSRGIVVDCTLPKLAGVAVDELGDQVRELWTP